MNAKLAGQPDASGRLQQVMRQHPLFTYFFMAYAFSWVMLIPFILSEWGFLHGDYTIAFALNPFVGPTLAAIVLLRVTEGRAGVLRLRHSLLQWRVGWQWYLFILLGIPALYVLGVVFLPGALASFQGLSRVWLVTYVITFIVLFFVGGPLGEEIGWRGYALPMMQARYGALRSTLLLGVLWTCWHLPHFLTSAQRGGPGMTWADFLTNFANFFVLVMALTVIFTWVFNHTNGSVLMAILLHASINTIGTVPSLFPIPIVTGSDAALLIGVSICAVLIVLSTRGRLGYRAEAPHITPLFPNAPQVR